MAADCGILLVDQSPGAVKMAASVRTIVEKLLPSVLASLALASICRSFGRHVVHLETAALHGNVRMLLHETRFLVTVVGGPCDAKHQGPVNATLVPMLSSCASPRSTPQQPQIFAQDKCQ
jgi:hypothetical protein